ncbi:Uncharacterised protein [Vibrio cholerae]|nr:Uncharacterised protein [Vibrio cholerae]
MHFHHCINMCHVCFFFAFKFFIIKAVQLA